MDALSREIRDRIEPQTLMSDYETRDQKFAVSLNANLAAERNTELAALSQRFSQQYVWQHHLRWVGGPGVAGCAPAVVESQAGV